MRRTKSLPHGQPVPGALADQLLHGLHIAVRHAGGRRLDRRALAIEEQAPDAHGGPVPTLTPAERCHEIRQELLQALAALCEMGAGHARGSSIRDLVCRFLPW